MQDFEKMTSSLFATSAIPIPVESVESNAAKSSSALMDTSLSMPTRIGRSKDEVVEPTPTSAPTPTPAPIAPAPPQERGKIPTASLILPAAAVTSAAPVPTIVPPRAIIEPEVEEQPSPPLPPPPLPPQPPLSVPVSRPILTSSPAITPSAAYADVENDDYDDENEDELGDFMIESERKVLSSDQRAAWKAKKGDLRSRRREFHGAVRRIA